MKVYDLCGGQIIGYVVTCLDGDGYGELDAVVATRQLFPPTVAGRSKALAYAAGVAADRKATVFALRQHTEGPR